MVYSDATVNWRKHGPGDESATSALFGETGIMNVRKVLIALSLLGLLSACGGPDKSVTIPQAQPAGVTSVNIGDHVVHFSAQSTDQLPPDVARLYGIVRSKNRAMLTVSILQAMDNKAVTAIVSVKAVNLTVQVKNITMRRINEEQAIYYVGEVAVANRETLIFDIGVTPDGVESSSNVRFKRKFFSD